MKYRNIALPPNFLKQKDPDLTDFELLCRHVQKIPYGRNSKREKFDLVITEGKGTCSSKHAYLKQVAKEYNLEQVKLILAIFKMNFSNTPGIGKALEPYALEFIPEAHCYLKIGPKRMDFTNPTSDFSKIKTAILFEKEIEPIDVVNFKPVFHKNYLKSWIESNGIKYSFEEIWKIRESCITYLSN